ncbi:MAG: hypothetical protein EAZ97_00565 [Bacteroidetes bacterium]|nr:MAG: hypothetical protein EAZ97_00565 [Bacteroidota bacterium]
MEIIADLVKIVLPAGIVLYGMYLVIKSFLRKDFDKKLLELKSQDRNVTLQMRLQAYERMTLFLERVSPNNLLPRLNNQEYTVDMFQQILIMEIRNEFAHNATQQIYLSDETWNVIQSAVERLISLISESASQIDKTVPSIELARKMVENILAIQDDITSSALLVLKKEARTLL